MRAPAHAHAHMAGCSLSTSLFALVILLWAGTCAGFVVAPAALAAARGMRGVMQTGPVPRIVKSQREFVSLTIMARDGGAVSHGGTHLASSVFAEHKKRFQRGACGYRALSGKASCGAPLWLPRRGITERCWCLPDLLCTEHVLADGGPFDHALRDANRWLERRSWWGQGSHWKERVKAPLRGLRDAIRAVVGGGSGAEEATIAAREAEEGEGRVWDPTNSSVQVDRPLRCKRPLASGAEGAAPAPQMLFERVVMARGAADVDALVKYGALLQARAQNRSDSSVHVSLTR